MKEEIYFRIECNPEKVSERQFALIEELGNDILKKLKMISEVK